MITSIVPDYDDVSRNGKEPEKESSREADEWLTIAEAARRLGIDPTQVRRDARRLETKDRTAIDVSPMRLSLSALIAIREGKTKDRTKDRTGQDDLPAVPAVVPADSALYERMLSDKEAENAFLRAELTAQREARDVAESELRRLMLADKSELVELRQRLALPPAPEHTSTTPEQTSHRPWWAWWRRKE